ncbi:Plasma membrane fusion protein prm1 [Wickerhamomyces ciferrii]|uniref:Plasma membrane fusion protein PRM1 n=1 Tax=Wickerhamomyces ciferrii (strain ATCC 14091 / BCRC 22168 / CBS 111 / JCM 3599 / NBRC 0793 / NRRL Y-1031 F-60-10) TaxID=1206466 RepID=K0KR95_WICCF|nr:Plasma membrane fusion protein prm1 [Wickerhamomyces ciferrii]CCH43779.1 Plasma membrane fusion protein prm1 [Wickerhamomyces ciferrii]
MKPYLTLKDRISQAWLNKYTILLILIALKLLLFHQSLNSSLENAKNYTLNTCPTIDTYVSNMISFPHYIAKSSNFLILKTIDEINEKTLDGLGLILTGAENLIIFALDMIIGTYACILVSTIDGAVDVAVNSTEHIIGWVNDSLVDITDDIEDGLTDISKLVNKAVDAAEKVKDFFDGDDSKNDTDAFKHVNLSIDALKNLNIPSSINSKLDELKDKTPDFEEVKNKTENLIKTPFEMIREKLSNTTVMNTQGDELFVPELKTVTICSDNSDKINKFYHDLSKDITIMVKIFVALLVIGSIMALIPIIWEEFRLWRRLRLLEKNVQNNSDPIEIYDQTFNKIPSMIGLKTSNLITTENSLQLKIRWLISYILSSRALILLGIAMAGILAVILQFIILSILIKSMNKANSPFDDITNSITTHIDDSITEWTDSTNDYLQNKETDINEDLFKWVKIATDSVNDTISTFVEDMNDAISTAFNGTILYNPVKTIVGCVIENKLIKIEKGLTWIHDNAEISLPRVEDEYLTQAWSNETTNGTQGDIGGITNKASGMISKTEDLMSSMLKTLIKQYKKSLMFELYISLVLLGLWFLQFIIGLLMLWINQTWFNKNQQPTGILQIGYPRQLTEDEQKLYGYPLTSNLKVINLSNQEKQMYDDNPFNDNNQLNEKPKSSYEMKNPFLDEKYSYNDNGIIPNQDSDDDDKSTLTELPTRRTTRHLTPNPFDEADYADNVSNVLSRSSRYSRYDNDEKNDLGYNNRF